ncbi:hypothetical protein GX408_01620 [bacterium]|nr:hypothetical protein [bacterium]
MRISFLFLSLPWLLVAQEKTCFQTAGPWRPEVDFHSDVAIVYGVNASFSQRMSSWRQHGYGLHFMTGAAWGNYADYFQGRFDGQTHQQDGQVDQQGEIIWHDKGVVPYIVPSLAYVAYLKSLVKTAIDQGVDAVHLEEPEFWARAGYSEAFQKEWQAYYHEPWQAPHTSADAAWRSSKLKYHLYQRALKEVFAFVKSYGAGKGKNIAAFVPTHSLINYAKWGIVSPEASLAALKDMDGYIAQVWTGTARSPVYYEGIRAERTFETAFLEYGAMTAMTQPTGRRVYFLTDPIEDDPEHTWQDYKHNYESTFTAQLLHPTVAHYEVMPWPDRIFFGSYQTADDTVRTTIPAEYATQIMIMINVLNAMPVSGSQIDGDQNIGVLVSDAMMFQRFPQFPDYSDPDLSDFFGMALPLLKLGVPVKIVQMENLPFAETLQSIKVLLMTYSNMKPLDENYHSILAKWVKKGGILIYLGKDEDPFQRVREWWNQNDNHFASPSAHLFKSLGFDSNSGSAKIGRGLVSVLRQDPKELVMRKNGSVVQRLVSDALAAKQLPPIQKKNWLHLRRDVYDVVAVMKESVTDSIYTVPGPVIDLYDPQLPVLPQKQVAPGETALLFNLTRFAASKPAVLAAASRCYDEKHDHHLFECTLSGPAKCKGVARIYLPHPPKSVSLIKTTGPVVFRQEWHDSSRTLRLWYDNEPNGLYLTID